MKANAAYLPSHLLLQYGKEWNDPRIPQCLMAHSDISVTLNTYTHWDFEDAKSDFQKIQNGKW